MKNNIRTFTLSLAAVFVSACGILDEEPTVICSDTFYTTEQEAQYALNGVYGAINSYQFYGQHYSLELSLNDDTCFYRSSNTSNILMMNTYDSGTAEIYRVWTTLYAGINNANAFLEAIEKTEFDKDGQMRVQARFLRAFYYYYLAQCWGSVPLRLSSTQNYKEASYPATKEEDIFKWIVKEMEDCIEKVDDSLEGAPSKLTKTAMQGFLARVYLFKAGARVNGTPEEKKEDYKQAMLLCKSVMDSKKHQLNPDYSKVFINMISDVYDRTYYESMWEADFIGNRTSPDYYSNGRIGDLNGLSSTGAINYENFKCNYAYGMFANTPKIWDMYMKDDRTDDETGLAFVTDKRQEWNIPPYNYAGYSGALELYPYGGDPADKRPLIASIDKTPYVYGSISTNEDPLTLIAGRNTGKFRRETCYEEQQTSKALYTGINFPILRYSDVLLMYAEAANEYEGAPSQEAYDAVKAVRDRAGIKTKPLSDYSDQDIFREFVRNERGRELCFESLRKYDLIRWGIYVTEMNRLGEQAEDPRWSGHGTAAFCSRIGASVQPKHVYLPIPDLELGVNNKIKQNPLW